MTTANDASSQRVRAALAVTAWTAALLQFMLSIRAALASGQTALDGVEAFFSYFTVLTNLFVALAAALPLIAGNTGLGRFFARPTVLGCATTAIVMVGAGYHLLLRDVWDPQGLQRVADNLLHYVVPVATLVYWLVFAPRVRLGMLAPLVWCLYPLGYLAYVLVRGALTGLYPYYFIDAANLGYPKVMLNAAGMFGAFLAVGALVRAVAVLGGRRRDSPAG
jgi:hypothetical protein